MDLLKAKAQRITRQQQVLRKKLMEEEEELEGDGGEWSAAWAERWRAKLQQLPEFQNTDEQEIRQVRQLTSTALFMLQTAAADTLMQGVGSKPFSLPGGTAQPVLGLKLEVAAG